MENLLAILVCKPRGSIWHQPFSLSCPDFRAKITLALAEHTISLQTLRSIAWDHNVSRFNTRYSLANALDNCSSLMSQNAGEKPLRITAVKSVNVRMAESIRNDFDTDFSLFRSSYPHILVAERLFGPVGHCCLTKNWLSLL